MRNSRTAARHDLDAAMRVRYLEDDLDDHDDKFESLDARVGKMLTILVGILISTTTASIMLAINLIAGN